MNESTILHGVPAAGELNRVPGFDPMKYLRKTVNDEGEPVMRMELRYQRLWFRLACPKGRMLLNPLRITDQLAIFEAKVFFHQDDATPASSFTSTKTAQETRNYIHTAQDEALTVALDNAGFGIQLCDVTQEPASSGSNPTVRPAQVNDAKQVKAAQSKNGANSSSDGQTPPNTASQAVQNPAAVVSAEAEEGPTPQAEPTPKPAPTGQAEPVHAPEPAPQSKTASIAQPAADAQAEASDNVEHFHEPVLNDQPADKEDGPAPAAVSAPVLSEGRNVSSVPQNNAAANNQQNVIAAVLNFPVVEETARTQDRDASDGASAPVNAGADVEPAGPSEAAEDDSDQAEVPAQVAPSYTADMTVEQICQVMTVEDARNVVVTKGTCNGWTMGQVADKRPSSLRFYLSGYGHCDNIQLAAATLLTKDLEQKKAG